ncbi:hypothetical protein U1Q18_006178 [Sarracenia purpurea var. burkii]
MLRVNECSPDSCHASPSSSSHGATDNGVVLHLKHHKHSALQLERTVDGQSTCSWEAKKTQGFSSIVSNSSDITPTMESSVELMREIASLEVKILQLERYLLSLYRTAFEQHLPTLPENNGTYLPYDIISPLQAIGDQSCDEIDFDKWKGVIASPRRTSSPCGLSGPENLSHAAPPKASSIRVNAPYYLDGLITDQKNADSGHRSLADHLGASCIDKALYTPDRLSEDIVKCISSIYCKLADSTSNHTGFSVSSTSSLSSSTTFSPRDLSDSWSPHLNREATVHGQLQEFEEENRSYATVIEVLKICLDDDSFNYAAIMLQKFRTQTFDYDVIHDWIFQAAYNVGGHLIDAHVIQSSILGIRSHYSLPWLQTLMSPGNKLKMGSTRHDYAIEYPEPLVHFALCSGAYSDPMVRVYKARNVFHDLKVAKEEFVQSRIHIHKETKVFLPKILNHFAKDMSMGVPQLLEVVHDCLSNAQHKAIIKCLKEDRPDKNVHWLPQRPTFRYMIHRELAEE